MKDSEIFKLLECSSEEFLKKTSCENKTASKPGGQRVNKKETAVALKLENAGICSFSKEYRNRDANLKKALRMLRQNLAFCVVGIPDIAVFNKYSNYFKNGLKINQNNPDMASVLGIIIGSFNYYKGDHKRVSKSLNLSNTCLCRFVGKNKKLLEKINIIRHENQLHPLKNNF